MAVSTRIYAVGTRIPIARTMRDGAAGGGESLARRKNANGARKSASPRLVPHCCNNGGMPYGPTACLSQTVYAAIRTPVISPKMMALLASAIDERAGLARAKTASATRARPEQGQHRRTLAQHENRRQRAQDRPGPACNRVDDRQVAFPVGLLQHNEIAGVKEAARKRERQSGQCQAGTLNDANASRER